MTETANILHNATAQSLVLMDEIGRGTSTFDGLSLAFASAEYLAREIKAYTLFATHYFELTTLEEENSSVKNVHFDATEQGDKIIFLHAIHPGPANKSYGVQVAQLAGVPRAVIQLAKNKLLQLESAAPVTYVAPEISEHLVIKKLKEINPDHLSARDALETLYHLKTLV